MRVVKRMALVFMPALMTVLAWSSGGQVASANPALTRNAAHTSTGKVVPKVSSGTYVAYQDERNLGAGVSSAGTADLPPDGTVSALGCANRGSATNIRVNQDCTARRQAEEQVAVNPTDPNNLVAGQNDSRIGFNHCGIDYSLNAGKTWGDLLPPFSQHFSPLNHTYDAASDPAVTFDGQGTAWFACVVFDVNTNASGLFAVPSTAALKGSAFANVVAGASPYVVGTEDATGAHFFDKEFIAGDQRPGQTAVYVTWTDFFSSPRCISTTNPTGQCSSNIMMSKWNGTSWGKPILVSGKSRLCVGAELLDPKADDHDCTFDQGSSPTVSTIDGSVFVVWNNGNTPSTVNQQLGRKINTDGTMGPIVKVGQDNESNLALCDFGRGPEECVRQIAVRNDNFPQIARDKGNANHLVAAWTDTRAGTEPGNYDVVVSESNDGGATWTDAEGEGTVLTAGAGRAYFEPAVAVTASGKVAVSEYLANVHAGTDGLGTYGYGLESRSGGFFSAYTPVSDSQTLPSPTLNPTQAGFLGDYSGMAAANSGDVVYPIWSDTRNVSTVIGPDQDVFIKPVTLP
jgi:hypothetical protein